MNIRQKCIEATADALNKASAEYEVLIASYPGFHETWEDFAAKFSVDAVLAVLAEPKNWTQEMTDAFKKSWHRTGWAQFASVINHVRGME